MPSLTDLSLMMPSSTLPMAWPAMAALATTPEAAAMAGMVSPKEVA